MTHTYIKEVIKNEEDFGNKQQVKLGSTTHPLGDGTSDSYFLRREEPIRPKQRSGLGSWLLGAGLQVAGMSCRSAFAYLRALAAGQCNNVIYNGSLRATQCQFRPSETLVTKAVSWTKVSQRTGRD